MEKSNDNEMLIEPMDEMSANRAREILADIAAKIKDDTDKKQEILKKLKMNPEGCRELMRISASDGLYRALKPQAFYSLIRDLCTLSMLGTEMIPNVIDDYNNEIARRLKQAINKAQREDPSHYLIVASDIQIASNFLLQCNQIEVDMGSPYYKAISNIKKIIHEFYTDTENIELSKFCSTPRDTVRLLYSIAVTMHRLTALDSFDQKMMIAMLSQCESIATAIQDGGKDLPHFLAEVGEEQRIQHFMKIQQAVSYYNDHYAPGDDKLVIGKNLEWMIGQADQHCRSQNPPKISDAQKTVMKKLIKCCSEMNTNWSIAPEKYIAGYRIDIALVNVKEKKIYLVEVDGLQHYISGSNKLDPLDVFKMKVCCDALAREGYQVASIRIKSEDIGQVRFTSKEKSQEGKTVIINPLESFPEIKHQPIPPPAKNSPKQATSVPTKSLPSKTVNPSKAPIAAGKLLKAAAVQKTTLATKDKSIVSSELSDKNASSQSVKK